jgi:hypothetical protein
MGANRNSNAVGAETLTEEQGGSPTKPFLFTLPEYGSAVNSFVYTAVESLARANNPILQKIPMRPTKRVPTTRVVTDQGVVIENEPFKITAEISLTVPELIRGDYSSFYMALDEAARHKAQALMSSLVDTISRSSDAVGNTVDANGPLTHSLITKVLGTMELDFDETGNISNVALMMHPDMAQRIRELPPPTEEERLEFEAMKKRKYDEFIARRNRKRLS